jgi:hypothetical protein
LGPECFLEAVVGKQVQMMKESPSAKFILDAVAGDRMIEVLNERFPEVQTTVIAVQADDNVREGRIAERQCLTIDEAVTERRYRDGDAAIGSCRNHRSGT